MRLFESLARELEALFRGRGGHDMTYHRVTFLKEFVNYNQRLEGLNFIRQDRLSP